jgi:hypothetical protein
MLLIQVTELTEFFNFLKKGIFFKASMVLGMKGRLNDVATILHTTENALIPSPEFGFWTLLDGLLVSVVNMFWGNLGF